MVDFNKVLQRSNLQRLLNAHDWTYDFSDDHRVWLNGETEKKAIRELILKMDQKDVEQVFNDPKTVWGFHEKSFGKFTMEQKYRYFVPLTLGQYLDNKLNKEDAMTSTESLNAAIDSFGMKVKTGVAKNAGEYSKYSVPRMDKEDKTKQVGRFEIFMIWGMNVQYVFPKNRTFQQYITVPFTQRQQDGFYGTCTISYQRKVEGGFEEEWNDIIKVGKETMIYKGETFAIMEPNDYFGWRVVRMSQALGMDDANKRYVYAKFRTMARAFQAGIKQNDKCPLTSLSVVYGPKTEMKQLLSGPHGSYLAPIKGNIEDIRASLYIPKEGENKGAEKAAEAFDKALAENLAE